MISYFAGGAKSELRPQTAQESVIFRPTLLSSQ